MGTDPERTKTENSNDNKELDEDDGDIIEFSNERDLSWHPMTLVQLDVPDLVREYCHAKGLSMDGSTWNTMRKETYNKMDKKKRHKDTVNMSTYKCDIGHCDVGNF
eukprot:12581184-Ditylum_brightwellii.AAC.1